MENNISTIILGVNSLLLVLIIITNFRRSIFIQNKSGNRRLVMDSCSLIDGRIVDLAEAGFTPEIIIIPSFIIRELQLLADGGDSHKRERARFGLDIANKLKELKSVDVRIDRIDFANRTTDDKLIALTKKLSAQLYTTDFNLAKVAAVEGLSVLNVHELAQKLKPNVLPGETLSVKIVQKGSSRGQGVGYTDDGTMVVVDQADRLIGSTLDVEIDRMINTVAGKMIFAKTRGKVKPSTKKHSKIGNNGSIARDLDAEDYVSDLRQELL